MANLVIAIIDENANGSLGCQARGVLELLPNMGLTGRALRLSDPEFVAQLDRALQEGVLFAWGCAGVGARLACGTRNVWDAARVPFISVLADAPFVMPAHHHVPTPYVINGYLYREWLELQHANFRSPQVSALLPLGVIANPARDRVPWSRRERRMLFVESGADPAALRAQWQRWPARLQPILQEGADMLAARGPGPIAPVVEACLAAHARPLDGCKPMLFGLLRELDSYIRALRATTMARALLALPVDIVGDGWDHIRHEPGRARFHPAMPAAALDAACAQTQFLVNVTPNVGSGPPELVLRGFAARCAVVSDDNAHARRRLRSLPSYHGLEWHEPDLAERLADIYENCSVSCEALDAAQAHVEAEHHPARFLTRMLELAQLARMQPALSGCQLDAA